MENEFSGVYIALATLAIIFAWGMAGAAALCAINLSTMGAYVLPLVLVSAALSFVALVLAFLSSMSYR